MRVKGSVLLYIFRLCWVKNSLSAPLKQTLLSIYIYSLIFQCDFPTGFYNVSQILGITLRLRTRAKRKRDKISCFNIRICVIV